MTARTDSPWSNRFSLPTVLEHQPRVEGEVQYTVRLQSGARYTVCRPQAAEDAAGWAPRPRYAGGRRSGTFNQEEAE